MSPAEPDDQDDPQGRSADLSAAFEEIVCGLRAEGSVPSWPEERASATRPPRHDQGPPTGSEAKQPEVERPEVERPEVERPAPEDDHFVPPDPPPLPPLGQAAAVGVALLALGVLLVVAPDLLGLSEAAGLTLGLITLAGGLGWLVLRSWSTDPPDDADPVDDGAVF